MILFLEDNSTLNNRSCLGVSSVVNGVWEGLLNSLWDCLLSCLWDDAVLAAVLGVCDTVSSVMNRVGQGAFETLGDEFLDDLGHDGVLAVVLGVGLTKAGLGLEGEVLAVMFASWVWRAC